jgi:peptidoglycan/xylan/chitin deacetylase (PgdA/CDA1 family)
VPRRECWTSRANVKATFFVIGEKLDDATRLRLAVRAHDEGHWIANHTFTHSVLPGEPRRRDTAENEIGRTQAAIGDLATRSAGLARSAVAAT